MATWKGHFDRGLLATSIKLAGGYPVGSLGRLSSGMLAVFVEQRKGETTSARPLFGPSMPIFESRHRADPPQDLSEPGCEARIVGRQSRDLWDVPRIQQLSLPNSSPV